MVQLMGVGRKGLARVLAHAEAKLFASVFKDTCWYYEVCSKSRPSSMTFCLSKPFVPISDRFLWTTLQQLTTTYSIKPQFLSLTSKVFHELAFMLLLVSGASPISVFQTY